MMLNVRKVEDDDSHTLSAHISPSIYLAISQSIHLSISGLFINHAIQLSIHSVMVAVMMMMMTMMIVMMMMIRMMMR